MICGDRGLHSCDFFLAVSGDLGEKKKASGTPAPGEAEERVMGDAESKGESSSHDGPHDGSWLVGEGCQGSPGGEQMDLEKTQGIQTEELNAV